MISPRNLLAVLAFACFLAVQSGFAQQTIVPDGQTEISGGGSNEPFAPALQYVEASDNLLLGDTELSDTAGAQVGMLPRSGTVALMYCNDLSIHSGAFRIALDLGDDYNFDTTIFSVSLSLRIEGVDTDPGGGTVILHDPVLLAINRDSPEQTFYVSYSGTDLTNHDAVDEYRIILNSYAASGSVSSHVRVRVRFDDEYAVDAIRPSPDEAEPIIYLQGVEGHVVGTHSQNPLELIWRIASSCADRFPSYQLQLLRLYNQEEEYQNDPKKVKAVVDWSQAMTFEVTGTESQSQSYRLTIPQGTGWYLWRVRPIGSLFPGGIADSRNWGVWSSGPVNGDVVDAFNLFGTASSFYDTAGFYYQSFEDTLNWTYARRFTEGDNENGDRTVEGMTFITPAGRHGQSQARDAETGKVHTVNSAVDFLGRSTLQPMSVPVGTGPTDGFKYRTGVFQNGGEPYSAKHFDDDSNYDDPEPASGSLSGYWDGLDIIEGGHIPTANGYPFARTLLATDGSGRPSESGGVGETYRIGGSVGVGGSGQNRTTKFYYASASDKELVRLFGDEAPADSSVYKVLVTDPNKVTTVSWFHNGVPIATALQGEQGDTLLVDLNTANESRMVGNIVDTLRANRQRGLSSLSSSKRYAFTDTTDITLRYKLTPDTVSASTPCVDTCMTCDYLVRIYIHPIDSKDAFLSGVGWVDSSVVLDFPLGGNPCSEETIIDTSFTLTLYPGTYVIERRLEVGSLDPTTVGVGEPYGRTYAEQFREAVATGVREEIEMDDSLEVVLGYLATNQLDSLYLFLGLDIDSLENYESVTLYTECCEVTFPILDPNCGFNPCRNGTPSFQDYLIDKWGSTYGTSLYSYFRFDGTDSIYTASGMPPNPFDTLVANMLADTNATGEFLYDCNELWLIWTGLVDNLDRMKVNPDNPSEFNPDFNLLDFFIQAAGPHYIDTSHSPYKADKGYLLWAHRYVPKSAYDASACRTRTGYNAGWHGDVDSSDGWQGLYLCWIGENRENRNEKLKGVGRDCDLSDSIPLWGTMPFSEREDSCMVFTARQIERDCETDCESRRGEFARVIMQAYIDDGQAISYADALCAADAIVDSCKADCNLTVFYGTPDGIDSVGSTAEKEAIQRVRLSIVEVSVPVDDGMGGLTCTDTTKALVEGLEVPVEGLIVDRLNRAIDSIRAVSGNGVHWNVMDIIRGMAPDSVVNRMTDSIIYIPPHRLDVSAYFELQNGCELWYQCDTIMWSDLNPGIEHPMISRLNLFLNDTWGTSVDSSSITGAFGSTMIQGRYGQTDTGATYSQMLVTEVPFVNGTSLERPINDFITLEAPFDHVMFARAEDQYGLGWGMFFLKDRSPNVADTLDFWYFGFNIGPEYQYRFYIGDEIGTSNGCADQSSMQVIICGADTSQIPSPSTNGIRVYAYDNDSCTDHYSIQYYLAQPFTEVFGYFYRDTSDNLNYVNLHFSGAPPDTCKIFDVRFHAAPLLKLTDSLCGTVSCPDICWRWAERPAEDWSDVDTIRPPDCAEVAASRIRTAIYRSINRCVEEAVDELDREYQLACGTAENLDEQITVQYPVNYIHFSLYYFDRAGRLVRTIPPNGVNVLPPSATRMWYTSHTHATKYDYDSYGRLVRSVTPDAGESRFWYDDIGRLRFSQDARLAALNQYAYTKYDYRGRAYEVGISADSVTGDVFAVDSLLNDQSFPSSGTERTYFAYDTPTGVNYLDATAQQFLRNRVSKVWNDDSVETHYSYNVHGHVDWVAQIIPNFPLTNYVKYDYELFSGKINQVIYNEGRVDEFRHRYSYDADNGLTQVETSFDGVVWDSDARYEYYPHGSVRRIEIGEDKLQGLDITYTIQGQLKAINDRTLAQSSDPGRDGDTTSLLYNGHYAADSFSLVLNYHDKDYGNIDGTFLSGDEPDGIPLYDGNLSSVEINVGVTTATGKYEGLSGSTYRYDVLGRLDSSRFHSFDTAWNDFTTEYLTRYEYDPNGNILGLERHAHTEPMWGTVMDSLAYTYKAGENNKVDYVFDQVVTGDPWTEDIENTQSSGNYEYDEIGNLIEDYDEGGMSMEWDSYGRIKDVSHTLLPGGQPQVIDYKYDGAGNRVRKSVTTVSGTVVSTTHTYYVHDASGTVVAIYESDCDGNTYLDIDFDGIPDNVDNCGTFNPDQHDQDSDGIGDPCDTDIDGDGILDVSDPCPYDPTNNCVGDADSDGILDGVDNCPNTWNPSQTDTDGDLIGDACDWDLDGDGITNDHDTCAFDFYNNCPNGCEYRLVELPIYGIGRVGVALPDIDIINDVPPDSIFTRNLNVKLYELSDHLGNVRAVVSDRKRAHSPGQGGYYADFVAYNHPYPFGMPQPGRTWQATGADNYRYGFNGMETDPEVKLGKDQHYTSYFRQYDPRVGRWWSNDPVTHPWESPYAAMYNNPVWFADPFGAQPDTDPSTLDLGTFEIDGGEWWVVQRDVSNGRHVWTFIRTVVFSSSWLTDIIQQTSARADEERRVAASIAREEARRARIEAIKAENKSKAIQGFHGAIDNWYAGQIERMQARDVEGSTFFDRLGWIGEDLVLAGISLTGSTDELSTVLVNSTDLDEIPFISTAVAIAHIHQEGWSWSNALDLGLALTDWVPGGGLADNVIFASFKYGDEALEGSEVVGKYVFKESAGAGVTNSARHGIVEGATSGSSGTILYRYGDSFESSSRLGRKSKEAKDAIGVHGVSTTTKKPKAGVPHSSASLESVKKEFDVIQTGRDLNHHTVILPEPVTKEVAKNFNDIFGRVK